MIGEFFSRQFSVFLLTGSIAAVVNFGSRIFYNNFVGFSSAIIFAYITGMIVAFVLAKIYVFSNSQQNTCRSATIFALVNLVAVAQTWTISLLLAHYILPYASITVYVPEIAHAIGIVVPVFTSYLGHKYWSFR